MTNKILMALTITTILLSASVSNAVGIKTFAKDNVATFAGDCNIPTFPGND